MSDRKIKGDDAPKTVTTSPDKPEANDARDASAATPAQEGTPVVARRMSRMTVALLSMIGPLVAIAFGLFLYLGGGRYVKTDNAYVKSDKIAVSADISGRVSEVLVKANQVVAPGTALFRIDREPFEIAASRAQAQLLTARHEGEALKFLYRQKLASLDQAKVTLSFYERQFERQRKLKRKAIASESTFDTANQNLQNARAQVSVLQQDLAQARVRLGGDADTPVDRLPGVLTAQAALKQAELNLKYTEVLAPVDGIITNFDLQKGEYVEAGKVIFSIVGNRTLWIEANFRETDLTHMRVGQLATIHVDAYPQNERTARIASINPATGAEFALLPPQNATGNWVKVVQRLPVRLELTDTLHDQPLRAGMSVIVEVDTQHRRSLGDLYSAITRWFGG